MMTIDFDLYRWKKITEDSRKWWAGELDRPLIHASFGGKDPGRPEPDIPSYFFTSFYDSSVSAEAIVDRWDYDLSCREFLGDAFPAAFPNFGPGVIAAFMGAALENGSDTVWFHPAKDVDIQEISFKYDPANYWLNRIKDICKAAAERWVGQVQVEMTDLGGNLDILSIFRPSEKLLFDLYDYPDEVKRLTWEAHELWWRYFDEINSVTCGSNPGYVSWAGIFSSELHYMLQCDFAYMLGPDMFDEFVKPELEASCKRMPNAFYHLDGPGQLPHLDSLLSISELKGIQWVPGTGAPNVSQWPEVYKKIRDAGKLIQIHGNVEMFDEIVSQLGSAKEILFTCFGSDKDKVVDCLKRYGAC